MTIRTALILFAAIALGGCGTVNEFGASKTQNLVDAQGNVNGYKQFLRNKRTGEVAAQVKMFTPIHNEVGDLIGYEEQTQDGAIIRDLAGRQVGSRFQDARSRGTNSRSKGITVIIGALYSKPVVTDSERIVTAQAGTAQLVASLSAAELAALR